jgi:protein disulfide isomerase
MLVHQSEGGLDKYKYTVAITADNLSTFVTDYNAGSLTKFLKSAEAPATNDEPVKVIVGTTFNDIVINNDKDVLVEFYAPWCGHCKTLDPKYTEAAVKLAGNTNVVLAKCDATANEVDGVAIQGFPTLKFWAGNAKDKAPVDYDAARETDDIINYMKTHATKEWVEAATATTDDL